MGEHFAGFCRSAVEGVPVFFAEDRRFKTMRVLVYARRPLDGDLVVAARALLPSLLIHGTRSAPNRPAIARRMEALYGAVAVPSVSKAGETQVFRASLDAVAGGFLPGRPPQLAEGLAFLGDLCLAPRLDGDGFPAAIFERERRQALDAVRTRIDDRGSHARDEAIRFACAGEPMATPDYGSVAALTGLAAGDPQRARMDLLAHGEVFAVACGAFGAAELTDALGGFLARLPARRPEPVPPPVAVAPRAQRRKVERVELQQSKLVLVSRFPHSDDAAVWIGRRLFVAMLGGGPQSRLFQEVREKQSLAYYASAGADRHKGLILVQVGCDEAKAEAVEAETVRQFAALGRGEFSDSELDVARAQMVHALDTASDAASTRCSFVAEHWLIGLDRTPDELRSAYLAADRELVVRAAQGIWHDLSFLLAPSSPLTTAVTE